MAEMGVAQIIFDKRTSIHRNNVWRFFVLFSLRPRVQPKFLSLPAKCF